MFELALLCLLSPLAAFVVQMLVGRRLPRSGDWVSIVAIGVSLGAAIRIGWLAFGAYDPGFRYVYVFPWLELAEFSIPMGILIDNLTAAMLIVVTLVSALVHLFSVGYMHGEERYSRYFGYLSLFSFSMLFLVLSDNLLSIYVGWELVGLSSYLLIGFFFPKASAAAACKKAFLTNRVGDIGMWAGILLVYTTLHTFRLEQFYHHVAIGTMSGPVLTTAGLLLFIGAIGKSAQFPLHVWLPDAMEGPTPVSALIHAATMVAAGVYLVGRLFPILTPDALIVIAYFGAFTAIFAATIALVQDDLKRVLAYSTVSQLGFMMVGLGVGSYFGGLYHLVTHAFFKACLFLGSGAVIHAVHTQNIWQMGGLRKKLPITFWSWIVATCAISGVPGLSGYFSKETILGDAMGLALHESGHFLLFALPMIAAGMTTFYMFRATFVTFFGAPRNQEKYDHAHEGGLAMSLPLVILTVLTLTGFAWKTTVEDLLVAPDRADYAAEVFAAGHELDAVHAFDAHDAHDAHGADSHAGDSHAEVGHGEHHEAPWGPHLVDAHKRHDAHGYVIWLSLVALLIGVGLAWAIYLKGAIRPENLKARFANAWRILYNKYFVDEFFLAVFVRNLVRGNRAMATFDAVVIDGIVNGSGRVTKALAAMGGWMDDAIVDGFVNGVAAATQFFGGGIRRIETGRIQHYFLGFLGGILLLVFLRAY